MPFMTATFRATLNDLVAAVNELPAAIRQKRGTLILPSVEVASRTAWDDMKTLTANFRVAHPEIMIEVSYSETA